MMSGIKIQDTHLHAITHYGPVSFGHFLSLFISVCMGKLTGATSITAHLPLEIQHPTLYPNHQRAKTLLLFGEKLKKLFHIPLYWENAPLLHYKTWNLQHGQTDWKRIPKHIALCLDTGHLMLGSPDIKHAQQRIQILLRTRGNQIRHIHLHENDLVHDLHQYPKKVITKKLLDKLIHNRTYILEK